MAKKLIISNAPKTIEGYKGFDQDLKCRDFQYEIGKEYEYEGKIDCCKNGFHFCENPLDVLGYYPPVNSRYCRVEGTGKIDHDGNDSKMACSKLKIKEEIDLTELIEAGIRFILQKVDWKNVKKSNTKYRSVATDAGSRSVTTNTGKQSVATNTGNSSAATNTGDWSVAINAGLWSAATNTGDRSTATNTGSCSAATNTGSLSAATNAGAKSAAINTGSLSVATNTGDLSIAANIGNLGAAAVKGQESVAIAVGYQSKAKGALGCWLMLAEWDNEGKHIIDMQCQKVDGENIKADTWYELTNGKFKECKEKEN